MTKLCSFALFFKYFAFPYCRVLNIGGLCKVYTYRSLLVINNCVLGINKYILLDKRRVGGGTLFVGGGQSS